MALVDLVLGRFGLVRASVVAEVNAHLRAVYRKQIQLQQQLEQIRRISNQACREYASAAESASPFDASAAAPARPSRQRADVDASAVPTDPPELRAHRPGTPAPPVAGKASEGI